MRRSGFNLFLLSKGVLQFGFGTERQKLLHVLTKLVTAESYSITPAAEIQNNIKKKNASNKLIIVTESIAGVGV